MGRSESSRGDGNLGARITHVSFDEIDRMRDDFLNHHGIKGMKWGVRKADSSGGSGSSKADAKTAKNAAKAEKKWEKKASSGKTFFEVYSAAAKQMNKTEIARINNKPEYRNQDFTKDTPLSRKYYKEYEDTLMRLMNREADIRVGSNPAGTKRLKFYVDKDGSGDILFKWENIKHADDPPEFRGVTDANGKIESIELVDDTLAHHGVKGMKWGVRRTDAQLARANGGESTNSSDDAARAQATAAKILEGGGTHAVTDRELQHLLTRMNMEQNYTRMTQQKSTVERGEKKVKDALKVAKTIQEVYSFFNGPIGKASLKLIKKMLGF